MWVKKWAVPIIPKQGLLTFKVFNFLIWKREVFKVRKYKKKIKFDQKWGVPKWGVSFATEAVKIQTF